MIKIIENNFNPSEFDRVSPHPMQSWSWGVAREKMGVRVIRIGEYRKDALINVFQLTLHPIPLTQFTVGYLPRSVAPSQTILKFLRDWAKKNNVVFIKFEPYVEADKKTGNDSSFVRSTHPLFPTWTQILDIDKTEEEIMAKMHHKTRYNIRLATKRQVMVREESNDKGFADFSKLYFETTDRQKYYGHNMKYHQTIWNTLKKDIAHLLIAYYDNIPLAAYELFLFKDTLYYVYGGTSDLHRNLMASNLLMWETIRLGKRLGAKKLDMWGSLPPDYDPTHPWSGFTRFKEGYGTRFVEFMGSFDLVIYPLHYRIYNLIYTIRELFLKLK